MKPKRQFLLLESSLYFLLFLFIFGNINSANANIVIQDQDQQERTEYLQYSGVVVNNQTNEPLVFATLTVNNTNISTITNSDGEFTLKIPEELSNVEVTISFIGYFKKVLPISAFKKEDTIIKLKATSFNLSEIFKERN